MANKRDIATAAGKLTYNSGKPCRSGHVSDRYTSNGMCIACTKLKDEARKTIRKAATIRYNNARIAHLLPYSVMVRIGHRDIIERMSEILQFGNDAAIHECMQFVEKMSEVVPLPRSLTRDDLLRFMKFEGGHVTNYDDLDIVLATEDDPNVYFLYHGFKYRGDEAMQVLRGQRFQVNPK